MSVSKHSPLNLLQKVGSDEAGSSLFLSSMLLMIGLLLAAGMFYLSSTGYRITLRSIEHTKAQYIAEAGVYRAISSLANDANWMKGYSSTPFGEGNYTVLIEVLEENSVAPASAKGKESAAAAAGEQVAEQDEGDGNGTEVDGSVNEKKPEKIVLLKAEGNSGKSKSLIEVKYDTGKGKILSWVE